MNIYKAGRRRFNTFWREDEHLYFPILISWNRLHLYLQPGSFHRKPGTFIPFWAIETNHLFMGGVNLLKGKNSLLIGYFVFAILSSL